MIPGSSLLVVVGGGPVLGVEFSTLHRRRDCMVIELEEIWL